MDRLRTAGATLLIAPLLFTNITHATTTDVTIATTSATATAYSLVATTAQKVLGYLPFWEVPFGSIDSISYPENLSSEFRPKYVDGSTGRNDVVFCASYTNIYTRIGDRNDAVRALQYFLNVSENAGLPVTGYFGLRTDAAVKAFQTKYNIPYVTGNQYVLTTAKINEIACAKNITRSELSAVSVPTASTGVIPSISYAVRPVVDEVRVPIAYELEAETGPSEEYPWVPTTPKSLKESMSDIVAVLGSNTDDVREGAINRERGESRNRVMPTLVVLLIGLGGAFWYVRSRKTDEESK